MAKRRAPGQKEYNPLDDARGRLPIDPDLVREVIGTSPEPPPRPGPAPAPVLVEEPVEAAPAKRMAIEKLTKYNKFLTTPTEKLELDRLAARISGALGVSVRPSHLIRACLIHLLHAENAIINQAGRHEPLKRPSNAEAVALAEFDQMIAQILFHGFLEAGPITPTPKP